MCGIYGFSLKKGADIKSAMQKFKILGLFNIERGRDATGVFIDGNIVKNTKEFDDFIRDLILPEPTENFVVLGHNRAGSFGYAKTGQEAHPFLINEDLVFTHNGTIRNVDTLCKKYTVDEKDYNVDSFLLGSLYLSEGPDVLTHYKGAAALAFTYLHEPNTLYLFHGASKDFKHGSVLEERPLYFLITSEGIFYSSLENSLNAIRESEEEKVENLAYNTVFKIVDGEFTFKEDVVIDREEANVFIYNAQASDNTYYYKGKNRSKFNNFNENSVIHRSYDMRMITKESIPDKVMKSVKDGLKINGDDFIYFHMGRYYKAPHELVDGTEYVKKGGLIGTYADKTSELLFFYRGVLLKDSAAYREIISMKNAITLTGNWVKDPTSNNFALEISKYSQYPVTALFEEYNPDMSQHYRSLWYKDKDEKNCFSFTPKYGGRNYNIKDGILTDIKSSHREKCLLETAWDVDKQIQELTKGSDIVSVIGAPGGSSPILALPFREEKEDKNDEILWFFQIIYATREEFDKTWGKEELEAFKRYVKTVYQRDFSYIASVTDIEIARYCDDMIEKTIKDGISIEESLEEEVPGDSDILLQCYEDVLNEKDSLVKINKIVKEVCSMKVLGPSVCMLPIPLKEKGLLKQKDHTLPIPLKESAYPFQQQLEVEFVEEIENKDEEIDEKIEECIVDLENIRASASDLWGEKNSDYATEAANVLAAGVDITLTNLAIPLDKYKKKELLERIDKVRENNNINDGIL